MFSSGAWCFLTEISKVLMTPKEKAEELVIKMYQPLPASKEAEKGKEHLYYNQYNAAKECALIAVDEILSMGIMSNSGDWKIAKEYWREVKEQIKNL
jgi:hypothetical protein